MQPIVLKAHFDGREIRLDEPFDLPPNARLMVTVLPPGADEADWRTLSLEGLARAYGPDEPEYPLRLVAEPHPE